MFADVCISKVQHISDKIDVVQRWIANEVAEHDGVVREQEVIRYLLGSFRSSLNKFSKASSYFACLQHVAFRH